MHQVSLSPEVALPSSCVEGLTIHHIPVTEHKAPTLHQIQDFIEICKKAKTKKPYLWIVSFS